MRRWKAELLSWSIVALACVIVLEPWWGLALVNAQDSAPSTTKTWPQPALAWTPRTGSTLTVGEAKAMRAATLWAEAAIFGGDQVAARSAYIAARNAYAASASPPLPPLSITPPPPVGIPGPQGPKGDKGDPGERGPPGVDVDRAEVARLIADIARLNAGLDELRAALADLGVGGGGPADPVEPPPPPVVSVPPSPPVPPGWTPPTLQTLVPGTDKSAANPASVAVTGHPMLPAPLVWTSAMASIGYGDSVAELHLTEEGGWGMQIEASLNGGPWIATRGERLVVPDLGPGGYQVRVVAWPTKGNSIPWPPILIERTANGWDRR